MCLEVSVAVSIVESRQVGVLTSYIPSVAVSPCPMVPKCRDSLLDSEGAEGGWRVCICGPSNRRCG